MKEETLKLKVGDRVWVRVPANGTIVKASEEYGYSVDVEPISGVVQFFDDDEVDLVPSPKKEDPRV